MPNWTKEQKEAIEKSGTNIIVSAGAGSGKTAVLSERVIYKLNNGIHIDELLILTFTRAAAEEMKDRIRKKIKKDPSLKNELDALDSSYITTFDSFALSVVKKYHYLLNITKSIEITDETIVKLEKIKIIEKVFDEYYENCNEDFANLIKRFSLKNDNAIRRAVLNLAEKIESYYNRQEYIETLKNQFFTNDYMDKIIDEFEGYIREKQKALALELENTHFYFESDYNSKLDTVLLPLINCQNIEELNRYKSTKLPTIPRGTDDEAKIAKENLKTALNDLILLTEFGTKEQIKEEILSNKETTITLIKIIERYIILLKEFKEKKNIFTFGDIAELSIKILKENESARLELKNTFKEIMIDEYQDTNDIQETFIGLISDNNVYMVGDIKQSIYRFRGSNPRIFKDKYDRFSNGNDGYKIDLIKNFRSRKEVLDNINAIFSYLMDDELGGAAYTVSHEMVYGNTSYDESRIQDYDYNFEVLEYDTELSGEFTNSEIEIFTIAKDIKRKIDSKFSVYDKETGSLRSFKYSDAVIILDRSKYFDNFKKIFEYLGIPLTILKDDKLNTSLDIYLIKNIVDLIIRIKNNDFKIDFRYDFLSIARSFIYEYSDEEIFSIVNNNSYKDTTIFKDFSKLEDYNSMTIKEFLMRILDVTDFFNKLNKIGDFENTQVRISKLIDMADSLGKMGYTIESFKDYLDEILEEDLEIKYTSSVSESDTVKILTIHKSKGLEYPVCYFADLTHSFNTRELKEKFINDTKYGFIIPIETEDEEESDSVIKILYKDTFIKEEIGEKIRLFYVALTRAREKMIIVLPKKETRKLEKNRSGTIELTRRLKFNSLGDFIYSVKDYLPKYFTEINLKDINLTKNYLYTKNISTQLVEEAVESFEVEELKIQKEIIETKVFSKNLPELIDKNKQELMDLGSKIHEILEYTDFKHFNPCNIEDEFIRKKIVNFLNSPLLKNIQDANIFHEYEFVYLKDLNEYHGSIDLMIEYKDRIDIIDYKLKDTTNEHYLDQLKGYKNYIEEITKKKKKISIYLYSILEEEFTKLD